MKRYESRKKKQKQRLQSDKGNCFFEGKIPFPPHFPSKSGTCTMMPSHMRKIIWLSLFYALYFLWHVACGMWHDVICPGGRELYFPDFVFPFHHLLPPASSYSSIIHLSLSPHQKMPCKNSGPDVTPEPNNVTLLNQPEIYKTNIKSFTIPLF